MEYIVDSWFTLSFLILIGLVFSNIIPCILSLLSKKVAGNDKIIWFLCSFIVSWIGYFLYYFIVVKNKASNNIEILKRDEFGRVIR